MTKKKTFIRKSLNYLPFLIMIAKCQTPEDIKAAVDFAVDPSCEQNATGKASSIIKLGLHNEVQVIRE